MTTTTLQVSDGTSMNVFVAHPGAGARGPGILVFQEAFGVNAHIRDVCTRFAALGYVAAAPELYHRTGSGIEIPYGDMEQVRPHRQAMTIEGTEADVRATFDFLSGESDGRIVCIGFCMGGGVSFLANSIVPLHAAVSFYGVLPPAQLDRASRQGAPILFFWGGKDKHIGEEQRAAVRHALDAETKPYTDVLFSFADHGFFCDQRSSYSPDAARDAWAMVTSFLSGHLAQPRS